MHGILGSVAGNHNLPHIHLLPKFIISKELKSADRVNATGTGTKG